MAIEIQPIGNDWFSLYPGGNSFEYNPGPNPLADLHDTRKPLASVYGHIDGTKAIAKIYGAIEKAFFYKDSNVKQALQLAKLFVEEHFRPESQQDVFSL